MNRRPVPFSALLALPALLLACSDSESPATESPPAALKITGRYEMSGVTTTPGSEHKRKIQGAVVLEQKGDRYVASYEFKTNFPGEGPPVDADVIGVGEGMIDGRTLTGSAKTQIVVSSVPGVDTGFAFIPRLVSARIVSSSIGTFQDDGSLHIEIESRADENEVDYQPTHTRMRGKRISDIGAKGFKPDPGTKVAEPHAG